MNTHIEPKPGPWDGENRPLFLAPMAGVSDLPFRLLAKACGADVTITEFTNSTALTREAAMSWRKMESHESEIPFIPQIFGGDPGDMATAAEMLAPTADIIDLNFGCPAPKVTKICAGAALMGQPENLVSMVDGIIERVDVPVTAKMRLGTGQGAHNALEICQELERIGTARLCVHGRTLRQRYSGEADWTELKKVVDAVDTPVIANGDVVDAKSAALCLQTTGAAGLMIGRGAIGRPSIFGEMKVGLGWMSEEELPWIKELGDAWYERSAIGRSFATRKWCWDKYIHFSQQTVGLQPRWMKRHAVAFTKGLPGAKKIRHMMHGAPTPEDFAEAISNYLGTNQPVE